MFHIAMPGSTHPTRRLLDALAAAHDRGVRVRVLVDRDRAARSVQLYGDQRGRRQLPARCGCESSCRRGAQAAAFEIPGHRRGPTIIGSHNWSAGSYFGFDDLSVDVASTAFARVTRQRFEDLWRRGTARIQGSSDLI
jgi:phosphatidylserine/phosphatidylglycerophosphate/cardiolipin synthase-like enzyme